MPYSSGTTGAPQGCLHHIRGVMATAYGSIAWNPASSESVQLATLPLFHVTGMQNSMHGPLYHGSTIVMMPRWDRRVTAELIHRPPFTHWRHPQTNPHNYL